MLAQCWYTLGHKWPGSNLPKVDKYISTKSPHNEILYIVPQSHITLWPDHLGQTRQGTNLKHPSLMEVSVPAAYSLSSWDFTATTSHGQLQNHTAALFKYCPLVDSDRISHMETFRIIQRLCLKRRPLVDLGQVWNSLRIPL